MFINSLQGKIWILVSNNLIRFFSAGHSYMPSFIMNFRVSSTAIAYSGLATHERTCSTCRFLKHSPAKTVEERFPRSEKFTLLASVLILIITKTSVEFPWSDRDSIPTHGICLGFKGEKVHDGSIRSPYNKPVDFAGKDSALSYNFQELAFFLFPPLFPFYFSFIFKLNWYKNQDHRN